MEALGLLLIAGLLAFSVWAVGKTCKAITRSFWRPLSEQDQQGLDWWTKKPMPPIVQGKRGGRYKRVFSKRTDRSYKRYQTSMGTRQGSDGG